jgi:hypothetical protein
MSTLLPLAQQVPFPNGTEVVDGASGICATVPDSTTEKSILAEHARAIHELVARTKENIIDIGHHLAEAREQCRSDGVSWLKWLEAEFDWSDETARRFIQVFELSRDDRFHTLVELNLPLGVLYRLAASKAEAARAELADHLEAGEEVTRTAVEAAITRATTNTAGDVVLTPAPASMAVTTAAPTSMLADAEDEEESIKQRRREHSALFGEPAAEIAHGGADDNNRDRHGAVAPSRKIERGTVIAEIKTKQQRAFDNTLFGIRERCTNSNAMIVPELTAAERREAIDLLTKSVKELSGLLSKISSPDRPTKSSPLCGLAEAVGRDQWLAAMPPAWFAELKERVERQQARATRPLDDVLSKSLRQALSLQKTAKQGNGAIGVTNALNGILNKLTAAGLDASDLKVTTPPKASG